MNSQFIVFIIIAPMLITMLNANVLKRIPGGIITVEVSERIEEIENMLKHNIQQLKDESLKLVRTINVTEQVVSGMSYVLFGVFEDLEGKEFLCEVSMWERVWLPEPNKLIVNLQSKEIYMEGSSGTEDPIVSSKSSGISDRSSNKHLLLFSILFVLTLLSTLLVV